MGLLTPQSSSEKIHQDDIIPFIADRSLVSDIESVFESRRRAAIACALWLARTSPFRQSDESVWRETGLSRSLLQWGK